MIVCIDSDTKTLCSPSLSCLNKEEADMIQTLPHPYYGRHNSVRKPLSVNSMNGPEPTFPQKKCAVFIGLELCFEIQDVNFEQK